MGFGFVTNDPNAPVVFPYELSGKGFRALSKLAFFYNEDESKIIDRLIKEKAAELGINFLTEDVYYYGKEKID